jgi:hypothetical protein
MTPAIMPATAPTVTVSKKALWAGRVISALPVLLMGGGGMFMLVDPVPMLKTFAELGYPASLARPIALVEVACVIIYCIPQTAVLGAILLTGYLGGATATHVRIGQPFYLPVAVGVLVWLGLYLREPEVRALIPWRCGKCGKRNSS